MLQTLRATWVCLKMSCTPKANGFADHYPYEKWLAIIGNINPTFPDKPTCVSFDMTHPLSFFKRLCQGDREVLQGHQVFTTPWFRQPKTWVCLKMGYTPNEIAI